MNIAQNVNYSSCFVSVYSTKKIVSQTQSRREIKELSEEEKLVEFKKKIRNEIDVMPWGCDISIHITDDAFKRMMDDNEFKDRMLNTIREDASVSGIKGGGIILNITESGYSGFSWMEGYAKEGSARVKTHSQGSFYYKMTCYNQNYMELWEERRHKREVQQEKLDRAYVEQLHMNRYWARKERIAVAYESSILENFLQE